MSKKSNFLKKGDILTVKSDKRLIMSCNTFTFEEFFSTLRNHLRVKTENPNVKWFEEGVECKFLSPHHDWQKGKVKITLEFIPDDPDIDESAISQNINANGAPDLSLDDIRQRIES